MSLIKPPNAAELKDAYHGITTDGPQSDLSMSLSALSITDPLLRTSVNRWVELLSKVFDDKTTPSQREFVLRSMVGGVMAYGMNVGLRIGLERGAAKEKEGGV